MTIRNLPKFEAIEPLVGVGLEIPEQAYAAWSDIKAAESDNPNTISIYDVIGEDYFGDGFSAKRMAGALRNIGDNPVTVNINSPGGSFFDGVAIYNLLLEHPAPVTVKVMGLAASAASVVAMAGDEIVMGRGTQLMIHNSWVLAIGNSQTLSKASGTLESFDRSMRDVYSSRSGLKAAEVERYMDEETFFDAQTAVDLGLADSVFEPPSAEARASLPEDILARRRIEQALAKQNISRRERSALMKQAGIGARDAADPPVERDADLGEDAIASMQSLIENLKRQGVRQDV